MKSKIFIDMDGVLFNFVDPAFSAFEIPTKEREEIIWANEGNPNMWEWLGLRERVFWNTLFSVRNQFIRTLPLYGLETVTNFLRELQKLGETFICSSPTREAQTIVDKINTIKTLESLGITITPIITSRKELLAKDTSTILIDDFDSNITAFKLAGGNGILFPRPWNSCSGLLKRDKTFDPYNYIVEQVGFVVGK